MHRRRLRLKQADLIMLSDSSEAALLIKAEVG